MALSIEINGATSLQAQVNGKTATVPIIAAATETDPTLALQNVTGTLDWGDGSPLVTLGPSPGTLIYPASHAYPVGLFYMALEATNFRYPTPDVLRRLVTVNISAQAPLLPAPAPVVIGPILPRDSGYPNTSQWNFQIGQDERILESSLRMLLLTNVGERIMRPNYGTNLSQYIFQPDLDSVEEQIAAEIQSAIATFEPRVKVVNVTVYRVENQPGRTFVDLIYSTRFTQAPSLLTIAYTA